MENQKSVSKPHLVFGIFYGLSMILLFVIMYVLNVNPLENPILGKLTSVFSYIILPILFTYLGISAFKKNNNGFISLSECLKSGVGVAFIGALAFALFSVLFNYIFPEYLDQILSQTKKIMIEQNPNMTSEQIELGISMTKKFSSPLFSIPMTLLIFSFLGLIYSLIIGLIVKKDRPQFL
ncbi:MAG: DUF4199 domain-containing protein [Flavobacterium sp.]